MPADQLYRADEQYLPLDEAIRRIAPVFRRVRFDRVRGDAGIREQYAELVALQVPEVILASHLTQLGMTVHTAVSDGEDLDDWVEFVLGPHQDVFVGYATQSDRERLRSTVEKLANVLGYQIADTAESRSFPQSHSAATE
jgi:hypothetical protein